MSRIEKALEKAAQLRESKQEPGSGTTIAAEPSAATDAAAPAEHAKGRLDLLLQADTLSVTSPWLTPAASMPEPVREEYKKLKSLVMKLTQEEGFNNTLVVTSTVGGEGKTITAINLAITLAQEYDHSVLLVDADLRGPSVHKYLGFEPACGLVHCLRDDLPIERALLKTGLGHLVVLPAGGRVDDPVERLSSKRMCDIIAELKHRYPERYIIFDTPPVLPFAEAQVLGAAVDSVVFVVREGLARAQAVKQALASLDSSHVLGLVYNDASSFQKQKHYYYY